MKKLTTYALQTVMTLLAAGVGLLGLLKQDLAMILIAIGIFGSVIYLSEK